MDAVAPNGAAPRHHDQATFATAERREARRLPAPNPELTNRSRGKSARATSVGPQSRRSTEKRSSTNAALWTLSGMEED